MVGLIFEIVMGLIIDSCLIIKGFSLDELFTCFLYLWVFFNLDFLYYILVFIMCRKEYLVIVSHGF